MILPKGIFLRVGNNTVMLGMCEFVAVGALDGTVDNQQECL